MTFVDQLRLARARSAPALHQFLLEYKPDGRTIHAFFEGYDDESFYMGFLNSMAPAGYTVRPHRCGRKSEVYSAYRSVDPRVSRKGRALFFVDKNLSDFLGESWPTASNIFVTEHYSTENYLVDTGLLRRALRELYQMTDSERAMHMILRAFERLLRRFQREMVPIMGWILSARRLGHNLSLDNLQMASCSTFVSTV